MSLHMHTYSTKNDHFIKIFYDILDLDHILVKPIGVGVM